MLSALATSHTHTHARPRSLALTDMDIEMSEGSLSMALKCAWALDHSLRLDEIIEGMDESENMPATQWAIEQEHMAQCLEAQVTPWSQSSMVFNSMAYPSADCIAPFVTPSQMSELANVVRMASSSSSSGSAKSEALEEKCN